jgi:hypothetical protein
MSTGVRQGDRDTGVGRPRNLGRGRRGALFTARSLRRRGRAGAASPSRRRTLTPIAAIVLIAGMAFGASAAAAAEPIVTIAPPVAAYTTAHISGTIDPADNEALWSVEYSANPEAEGWTTILPFQGPLAAGSGPHAVSSDLSGLAPGTEYQVRFVVYAGGEFHSEIATFTTKPVAVPSVAIDPITTFTGTTADFSGTVDPNAPSGPLSPAAEAAYRTSWHFECNPGCPGVAGVLPAGDSAEAVSGEAIRLEPNTAYEVSLVAVNAGGSTTSGVETFQTPLIAAGARAVAGISDGKGGYILQGVVNPHNSEVTDCHFEYGLTADYGQSLPCQGVPGAGGKAVEVTARLAGLVPGATYHFRVSATNGAGPADSADGVFVASVTPKEGCPNEAARAESNSLALPECRAYELASNGFTAGFSALLTEYSEDGSLVYQSYAGNVAGSGDGGAGNKYAATRSSTGWETIANLNGPSESVFAAPEGFTECGCGLPVVFSTDLRSSLWLMGKTGETDNALDLYLRGPDGRFALIGPSTEHAGAAPGAPGHQAPGIYSPLNFLIGASDDLSHIAIESDFGQGLWEYVGTGNDRPRQVDVDSSGHEVSECGIVSNNARQGSTLPNSISSDGRVIVFTTTACPGGVNEVWARVDGSTSYDASRSQCTRTASDPGGACDAAASATVAGRSADGSQIYFTTAQQLVNGDTNEGNDLYEYELPTASNPAPSPALTDVSGPGAEADVERVVNVSDDGSRVYYLATGVLATNADALGEQAVPGDHNLYVWQRDASHPTGRTTFVGKLDSDDVVAQSTPDGRYLVLTTASPLVPTDTDTAQDVYRYDSETGEMTRVSTDVAGVGGNREGFDATIFALYSFHRSRDAISDNGEEIVFDTGEALSPADTNGVDDAYLWSAGRVSLVSTGRSPSPVELATIDGSGTDIYFPTTEALSPDDADVVRDVYDARVDGGFSFAHPASCTGESCQPALSRAPAAPSAPASATLSGPGNPSPPASAPAKPKAKPLTKAQQLAKALKTCRKDKFKRKRSACEAQARKRFGTKAKPRGKAKPTVKAKPRKGDE